MWRVTPNEVDRALVHYVYLMLGAPRVIARLMYLLLCLRGTDIHPHVRIGRGLVLQHGAAGVVLHSRSTLGDNVTVYQGVTIGRSDIWRADRHDVSFRVGDEAILCAGAVLLGSLGELRVGTGTVVGANSVLTRSTGDWEIWAGNPARKLGVRLVDD